MVKEPDKAWFRRAEGLFFEASLCHKDAPLRVTPRRQEDERPQLVPLNVLALLGRLNRWQTAAEAGVPPPVLTDLVGADLAFWSSAFSDRHLHNRSLDNLHDGAALAANVSIQPLLGTPDKGLQPFPFMARRGMLDDAVLAGALFSTHEMDTVVTALRFACCPHHAQRLRDFVPRMVKGFTAEAGETDADFIYVVKVLNTLGFLEKPQAFRFGNSEVAWLGHAAIYFASANHRIVVDPLFPPVSIPARRVAGHAHPRQLGALDAILITHGDNDHLNPQSLFLLPRDVPVVLPRAKHVAPYQVDMRRVISLLGFRNIREVDEWEELTFGDIQVLAVPFFGEDWGLSLAARTYLVSCPDTVIYASADSITEPSVCERLESTRPVDLAFVGISGAAETYLMPPGYGYGEFYAAWIPRERRNEWVQLCNGPKDAADLAAQIGARLAFGYAAGGSPQYELAYVDRGTHAELAQCLKSRKKGPRPFELKIGLPVSAASLAKA